MSCCSHSAGLAPPLISGLNAECVHIDLSCVIEDVVIQLALLCGACSCVEVGGNICAGEEVGRPGHTPATSSSVADQEADVANLSSGNPGHGHSSCAGGMLNSY